MSHHVEKRHQRTVEDSSKRWIDLDENVLDGYILIDDRNLGPSVPEFDGEELPYPEDATEYDDDDNGDDDGNQDEDTGSHGRCDWSYNRSKRSNLKQYRSDFDFGVTYPLANSHGNAYQDSSSHSKYTKLYAEQRKARNNLEIAHGLDMSSYAVANSHGEHGNPSADIRDRGYRENSKGDNQIWDTRPVDMNYEIANSHSNYRVFYDSQTQHQTMMPPWSSEPKSENYKKKEEKITKIEDTHVTSEKSKNNAARKENNKEYEANQSEKINEPDSETNSDIEQCLVQIEESLLNIEQNLLHVQDLDIPELRNLLYKSPSIERSLYEDLLYTDGNVPVIPKNKSTSLDSDEEQEENEEEEEIEEEEVWIGQNITIKDNEDEDGDASAPLINSSNEECSDTINVDEHNSSKSADDHYTDYWTDELNLQEEEKDSNSQYSKKNFVLNSLGKTLPRKIALDEVKENIRLCSSESEEPTITIDYNLNSAYAEKKSLFRDKWHSRASSLDENSIFQNSEFGDKQENDKPSLQEVFLMATGSRRLAANVKALSEGTLQTERIKRRDRRGSHEEKLLQAVEATADFRKKLESFASQRRYVLHRQKRMMPKLAKEILDNAMSRSKEKSPTKPKRAIASTAKTQDRDNGAGKNTGCDKRKRKKSAKNQSTSENALVPSKLISLSLSLLLAALLQAVRCLTDLVEDAFRSVSFDKNGLLQ